MWRLVHQWSFLLFWLFLTIGTLLVHCWYCLGRHVTIDTPMVIFAVLTVFWLFLAVFDDWYTVGALLVQSWQTCDDWYTNGFECFWRLVQCIIRQKQSKDSQTAKMTIGVPIVTCLHRVRWIHKAAQTPLLRETSMHMCLCSGHSPSPVGRADSMCLHGRLCVWLPFSAACCCTLFYLLMMPAARLVCQRPSSNFP